MLCSRLQPTAPWRRRLRRLSCISVRKRLALAGLMRYSICTTTRPLSGWSCVGGVQALEGLRSSSAWRSVTRRCTSSITSTPVAAAHSRLVGTLVSEATLPHSAAPMAVPPMMDIW